MFISLSNIHKDQVFLLMYIEFVLTLPNNQLFASHPNFIKRVNTLLTSQSSLPYLNRISNGAWNKNHPKENGPRSEIETTQETIADLQYFSYLTRYDKQEKSFFPPKSQGKNCHSIAYGIHVKKWKETYFKRYFLFKTCTLGKVVKKKIQNYPISRSGSCITHEWILRFNWKCLELCYDLLALIVH